MRTLWISAVMVLWMGMGEEVRGGKIGVGRDGTVRLQGPPVPTQVQLEWSQMEIGVMTSWDLVSVINNPNPQHFCLGAGGDHGFAVPPASAFNPTNVSTDQWVAAAKAAGAEYIVHVASHCSGFLQWRTNTSYSYGVRESPYTGDVLDDFMASCKKYDVKPSLYLTVNYNYLYNVGAGRVYPPPLAPGQRNITWDVYLNEIVVPLLEEAWGRFPGALVEAWFDGGEDYWPITEAALHLQPNAVYMAGHTPVNQARLSGHESGFLPYPVWSNNENGTYGPGSPTGPIFAPIESDSPISTKDSWFWHTGMGLRSLDTLKAMYHASVGANSNLLLGVMPDNTGQLPSDQVELLAQFGDFVRTCYGPQAAAANWSGSGNIVTLNLGTDGVVIDRIVLQEDQSGGQQVAQFSIQVEPDGGYRETLVPAGNGTAVGNKRIHFFSTGPIPATKVIITVHSLLPGFSTVKWRNVAVFPPCS